MKRRILTIAVCLCSIASIIAVTKHNGKSSGFKIASKAKAKITNSLKVSNGSISVGANAQLEGITNLDDSTVNNDGDINTTVKSGTVTNGNKLSTSSTINLSVSTVSKPITVSGNATLEGVPKNFTTATSGIALSNSATTLNVAVSTPIATNISLAGGTLNLQGTTKFGDGNKTSGTGIINCNNNALVFGGKPITLGDSLTIINGADLQFYSTVTLTGSLLFSGDANVSGNGNILDLSVGPHYGAITVGPRTTLNMTNLVLKGIGTGTISLTDQTSTLSLSNVQIALSGNYTVPAGVVYVHGPTTFATGGNLLTFNSNGNLTVDTTTLWVDPLSSSQTALASNINCVAGNNLTLVNKGTIRVVADNTVIRTTSNYHAMQIRTNSNQMVLWQRTSSNYLQYALRTTSNALLSSNMRIRTNSNQMMLWQRTSSNYNLLTNNMLRTTSDYLSMQIRTNSNALILTDNMLRTASDYLSMQIRTDSNALILTNNMLRTVSDYLSMQIRTDSNALILTNNMLRTASGYLSKQIRTNSNQMMLWERTSSNYLQYALRTASNALVYSSMRIRTNSNQMMLWERTSSNYLQYAFRTTSNALVYSSMRIRTNSNQMMLWERTSSNYLQYALRTTSNALLYSNMRIRTNSNAFVLAKNVLRTTSNYLSTSIMDNSNAIILLSSGVTANSNAIINLDQRVTNNSNAIVSHASAIDDIYIILENTSATNQTLAIAANSNAIISLVAQIAVMDQFNQAVDIRTNSNALVYGLRVNSNTIMYQNRQIRTNSNAFVLTKNLLRTTSNYHAMQIRTNSNEMMVWQRTNSNALSYGLYVNSNAIINLGQLITNNSNAIVFLSQDAGVSNLLRTTSNYLSMQINSNSNAIVFLSQDAGVSNLLRTTSNYLATQINNNSNAIVFLSQDARVSNFLRTTSDYLATQIRTNSNTLLLTENVLRTTSNYHAMQIRTNSNEMMLWQRTSSNYNLLTNNMLRTASNYLSMQIRTNSNALINQIAAQDTINTTLNNNVNNALSGVLTNRNAINTQAVLLRTTSNALLASMAVPLAARIMANSNAILKLVEDMGTIGLLADNIVITDASYTLAFDISLSDDHTMTFSQNCLFNGKGHSINFARTGVGMLNLEPGMHVTLSDVVLHGYNTSMVSIGAGATLTFGQNTTVELTSDQDMTMTLTFQGASILQGNGNRCNMATGRMVVGHASQLLCDNIIFDGMAGTNITCLDSTGTVSYQNVQFNLDHDVTFTSGRLGFLGRVYLTGDGTFTLASAQPSLIGANTLLFFDHGVTLGYVPPIANKKLFQMTDQTSLLFLNGASLSCSTTGMELTKGTVIIDGIVPLYNNGGVSVSQGFVFGDHIAADDLAIELMPGAQLALQSGSLAYANVH